MHIRQLTPDDLDLYMQVRRDSLTQEPASFGTSIDEFERRSLKQHRARLITQPHSDNAVFAILNEDESLCNGMVGLQRLERRKTQHLGWIWGVYVNQAYRRMGLARKLLTIALTYAHQLSGLEQIKLTVVETNQGAIRLYESLGFETYGQEPCALKLDGSCYDERYMMLFLNAHPAGENHDTE